MITENLPRPTTRTVPAATISTDARFQRDLVPARVRKIAADLDLDGIGIITVSERNGSKSNPLVCIDGQHRLAALEHHGMGEWEVECRVYSGLTLEQEAALFRRLNDTRRITSWDDFKAGIAAKDKECLDIAAVAKATGWKVSACAGDGRVCCVAALRHIYRQERGTEILTAILGDVREAWGPTAAGVEKDILRGLAFVYATYGEEIERPVLVKKLAKAPGGPSRILGTARGLKEIQPGSVYRIVAGVIVGLYNKGRRSGLAPLLTR